MHHTVTRVAASMALAGGGLSGVAAFSAPARAATAGSGVAVGGYGNYLAIVEAHRGGTIISISGSPSSAGPEAPAPAPAPASGPSASPSPAAADGTGSLSVVDSKGSYFLQVKGLTAVPGLATNGESTLSEFDKNAMSLTTWVVGSDGFVSPPIVQPVSGGVPIPMTSSGASETGAVTTPGATARVRLASRRLPRASTAAAINNICSLYAVGPAVDWTEFGRLIEASALVECSYPSTITLSVELQQFVNWNWYTVNQRLRDWRADGVLYRQC